jgi:enhancing lycopene biosynthesis protein 2
MSAEEYEAIRADGARFLISPSDEHVCDDEEVVARNAHYWVVEKFGEARRSAKRLDPRSRIRPLRLRT